MLSDLLKVRCQGGNDIKQRSILDKPRNGGGGPCNDTCVQNLFIEPLYLTKVRSLHSLSSQSLNLSSVEGLMQGTPGGSQYWIPFFPFWKLQRRNSWMLYDQWRNSVGDMTLLNIIPWILCIILIRAYIYLEWNIGRFELVWLTLNQIHTSHHIWLFFTYLFIYGRLYWIWIQFLPPNKISIQHLLKRCAQIVTYPE